MDIKKILVPIDFSPCSVNALRMAVFIAKMLNSEMKILTAVNKKEHADASMVRSNSFPDGSHYMEDEEKKFDGLIHEIPELCNILYETHKASASFTHAIEESLQKDKIDFIIMGTKGSHDSLEKLIGSNSSKVIAMSNVPVLMIPENIKSLSSELIGFAADLKEINDAGKLELLNFFAKATNSEVKIFHIAAKDDDTHSTQVGREKMKILNSLTDIPHSYVWISEEDVYEGIIDFIEKYKVDMMVMYPRHHSFWDRLLHGSVTKKVALSIHIPLLAIPD